MKRIFAAAAASTGICLSLLTGVGAAQAADSTLVGKVTIGGEAVSGARVALWRAGRTPGSATRLDTVTTAAKGGFRADLSARSERDVVYVQVSGGSLAARLVLMAVLTPGQDRVVVNELTTVAASYGLAPFFERQRAGGTELGLTSAAAMAANVVDPTSGLISDLLSSEPNGSRTQTLATVNSLANILVRCNDSPVVCRRFARFTDGSRTVQGLANLAQDPSRNVKRVFTLSTGADTHAPALTQPISAWVLGLKFVGNGRQFNAPGNFIFDDQGSLWISNNYVPSDDPTQVCGGRALLKLDPYEAGQTVTEFFGGGVNGVGFGISFDRDDNVWVSNYGFMGSECTDIPPSNSLSQFTLEGVPLSPDTTGFTQGPLSWPQGMALRDNGDVLTASCGNDTVVVYPDADPDRAVSLTGNGLSRPFDVVVDSVGNSWVTNVTGNSVSAFAPDGTPLPGSPFATGQTQRPLGLAIDSNDSKWIANSIRIKLPCGNSGGSPSLEIRSDRPAPQARITHIDVDGVARNYSGGGLTIPWGIAVDGNEQVWVANFEGQRVSRFCGTEAQTCPRDLDTGANISGRNGYGFDGLQRNTGVSIDQAGNVWLANNWKSAPVPSNPGGDGMVVFVGAGAPVD